MTENSSDKIRIHVRSNEGEDQYFPADNVAHALRVAKTWRRPDSHMVCIEINDVRTHRWDRPHFVGDNKWRKVALDEFETLGPIRTIY